MILEIRQTEFPDDARGLGPRLSLFRYHGLRQCSQSLILELTVALGERLEGWPG